MQLTSTPNEVKVWDPLVRIFHWTLVIAFFIAYIVEEELLDLHVYAGYVVLGLIGFRLLWGFIGTRHARFSDFVRSPGEIRTFLTDTLALRARRYLGHNPAGGAMIIVMLISLLLTTVTGIAIYGAEEQAGPMATWFTGASHFWQEAFEETHEFFANFTLLLVFVHVAGVIVESLIHRENLVQAMFSGHKRNEDQ